MRLRCIDLPGPSGAYVACGNRVVPFTDEAARALAQDAMVLCLSPEHAERLISRGVEFTLRRQPVATHG